MKNKASLLLMEQLVMILVFALCAALCLQCFVAADEISRETALRDRAVLLAQNTAECMKAGHPIPHVPEGLSQTVEDLPSHTLGLKTVEISVFDVKSGSLLIAITVGIQEVAE